MGPPARLAGDRRTTMVVIAVALALIVSAVLLVAWPARAQLQAARDQRTEQERLLARAERSRDLWTNPTAEFAAARVQLADLQDGFGPPLADDAAAQAAANALATTLAGRAAAAGVRVDPGVDPGAWVDAIAPAAAGLRPVSAGVAVTGDAAALAAFVRSLAETPEGPWQVRWVGFEPGAGPRAVVVVTSWHLDRPPLELPGP